PKTIYDGVAGLLAQHAPDVVALEESYVGADPRIALSVGQARGAALVACAAAGVAAVEYAPAHVKRAVCGYGRAEKAQIKRMVRLVLGVEVKDDHASDALAVALCPATAPRTAAPGSPAFAERAPGSTPPRSTPCPTR